MDCCLVQARQYVLRKWGFGISTEVPAGSLSKQVYVCLAPNLEHFVSLYVSFVRLSQAVCKQVHKVDQC